MAFLDEFSKKISDVGQSAIQKTKDMADIAKYNSMITDEEKKITDLHEQIGKLYVERFGASPDEEFKDFLLAINQSKDKIAEYQKSLTDLKGVSKCPECGAEVPSDALFCTSCGAKIAVEEAVETKEAHCAGCGAVVPEGSNFCTVCGKPVAN